MGGRGKKGEKPNLHHRSTDFTIASVLLALGTKGFFWQSLGWHGGRLGKEQGCAA